MLVACSWVGCVAPSFEPEDQASADVEVAVTALPLTGTTLFQDTFATRSFGAWSSASSAWTTSTSLASAGSYALLPASRSGAPLARVGTCSGSCYLQSGGLRLTGSSAVSLEFSLTTTLSSSTDFVGLRVHDGSSWRDLGSPWPTTVGPANWRRVVIDLSAYRAVSSFRFAFYGRSLESGDFAQVDDVQLIVSVDAPVCGDGRRAGAELCDGTDLGGNTCTGLGFNGGTLACSSTCALDTSGCTDQTQTGVDCRDPSTWPAAWSDFENQVLLLVNQRRAAGASCGSSVFGAAPALSSHDQLRQAARCHSLDMATLNYFSHTGLDGSNPGARIAATGYVAGTWGENIAAGQRTAQQVVDGWVASEGHCRNLMNKNFAELGVGYAFDADASYDHYWTQNFGTRR